MVNSSSITWTIPAHWMLLVPSSSERMLEKSLQTPSDVIIYDLEDSIAPSQKNDARTGLEKFLSVSRRVSLLCTCAVSESTTKRTDPGRLPSRERIAVRINAPTTSQFSEDMEMIVRSQWAQCTSSSNVLVGPFPTCINHRHSKSRQPQGPRPSLFVLAA
jgi:hypothetical protein